MDILQWAVTTIVGILGILVGREWAKRDRNIGRDKETFNNLLKIMPSNGSILFLRHKDYGGVFRLDRLDDLMHFTDASERPEFSFIDKNLEKLRRKLLSEVQKFRKAISEKTVNPPGFNPGIMRVKRPEDDPSFTQQQIETSLKELDSLASDLAKTYDELIKTAREKL